MIKNFAISCISDEIHHPYITKLYRTTLIGVVLTLVLVTLFDNNQVLHQEYHQIFLMLKYPLTLFLVLDFLLRFIGASSHYDMENIQESIHYNSLSSYIFSPFGIVDILSILPFFLLLFGANQDIFIVLSLITLLKIARFSPALLILKDVIINERKSLAAAFYLMIILTLSISTILYFVERDANPQGFNSLLDSIWWAIVTLSTVGYGDVTPITPLGKLLGGLAAITGFGMFALPAGILASGFTQEIQRLRDTTNWQMVASVPLFKDLEFGIIADIAKLLHLKRFRKNETIIKKGANGDAMYFILDGSVKVIKDDFSITLKEGDFFGEIALVKNIPRTATVVASSRCELLELTTYDFQNFIKNKPELYSKIEEVAHKRLG